MRREVELLPDGTFINSGSTNIDPANGPYTTDATTQTLQGVWGDASDGNYWYSWPDKDAGGVALALARFNAPPTLVLILNVRIVARWSYSQGGPNNWYFPGDNAHGPRLRIAIRDRAGTGYNYSPYHEIAGAEINDQNENIFTHIGYVGPAELEWSQDAHPEGGPFTLDDLSPAKFAAGAEWTSDSPAFLNVQGSFFKLRVHRLQVFLTVEDLGGDVENVRHSVSLDLRFMRRARNVTLATVAAHRAVGDLGSVISVAHSRGPSVLLGGWGKRLLERRSGLITKRTFLPEARQIKDEIYDREPLRCLLWAAYRIDGPWSPELQGLAYLDKGGGFTHSRAQDAWSPRPGDGVLQRVIEDYANLSPQGLAAQGGSDIALCLRNYDLSQAGWSAIGVAGAFTLTASTTMVMVEEQGYLSSALLDFGAGGGQGGRSRSLGTLPRAAGEFVHVRVVVRNSVVPTPATQFLEWALSRSGGGLAAPEYWDEANRVWTTTATYNAIPSTEPSGEAIADAIPSDAPGATSDPTYLIQVGRFSSNLANCQFHGALVDVQRGGAPNGGSYGARSPLVTLAATITREPDVHRITNSATAAAEVFSYARGVTMVEARPQFRAEVMPDDEVKPLLHARHAASSYDALQFVAKTASADLIRFERAVSGQTTFQLDCPIGNSIDLSRGHVLRAWVRWLGADGWKEFGPYSVEVGYAIFSEATGALLSSGSVLGRLAYEGNVAARDWVGVGNDESGRSADCYIRLLEVRRNPITGVECVWRL